MDLIKMAREMGKEIQATEAYKAYEAAKKANDEDEALQNGINEFNLKRMALNQEMQKEENSTLLSFVACHHFFMENCIRLVLALYVIY